MKVDLKIKQTFDIKYIVADFGVRYFEDSELNGQEDDYKNPKMPCVENGRWKIKVDVETGEIINWEKGNTAHIHYKVCDDGQYILIDNNGAQVGKTIESYVPDIFAINDNGYGDYVIMSIDENGIIDSWECTTEDIENIIKNDFYYNEN